MERFSTGESRPGGVVRSPARTRPTLEERKRLVALMGPYTVVPKTKRRVAKQRVAGVDRSLEAAVARANRAARTGETHRLLLDAARRRAR